MTQETERRQGMFVIASFDRMFTRERKNQDGTFTKTHYVGLIIRSETETRLCEVRTNTLKNMKAISHSKSFQCKYSHAHLKTTSIFQTKHKQDSRLCGVP